MAGLCSFLVTESLPQELSSIKTCFEHAEEFEKNEEREIADRYYLLALQKIKLFLLSEKQVKIANIEKPVSKTSAAKHETASSAISSEILKDAENETPLSSAEKKLAEAALSDAMLPAPATTSVDAHFSDKIIGRIDTYKVKNRETISIIAAKLGVSRQHLAKMNGIRVNSTLKAGQEIKYDNRRIVPLKIQDGIVINIPDRTLYFFRNGKLQNSLPVALGKPVKNRKYDWTTPTGKFTITAKQKNPTWKVPASIRSEMEEKGQEIIETVPPGPTNPLGKYAIKTSIPNILIHSTSEPASIYSFASHGCIRVYPETMENFFYQVRVKSHGEIIYRPVKIAMENNRVFLEVHRDIYGKSPGLELEARKEINKLQLKGKVDWKKVESVVKHSSGIAEDVTLDMLDSAAKRAKSTYRDEHGPVPPQS